MIGTQVTKSADIRSRLGHPVIDADGHTIEFEPAFLDYLKQVGGTKMVQKYIEARDNSGFLKWYRMSAVERRDRRATRPAWWGIPAKNTLDRATATLPKLLYERMEEFGLDFTVLYPTLGFILPLRLEDEELRRASCRAFNNYYADLYREYADRMTAAAVIPMHTPQEAINELDHAVSVLGMKVVLLAGYVRRPVAAVARQCPEAAGDAFWLDTFGVDSAYDYDPVWAKCVELKVAPSFHSSGQGWGSRTSVNNYIYNHIGDFASAGEAVCKSLFMGGVTRRFPTLRFAFLEGGVGWACSLYSDLIGHWKKRNRESIQNYNPANVDQELLVDLFRRYGGKPFEGKLQAVGNGSELLERDREDPSMLDEWAPCKLERAEDIRDLFISSFYFGCEADDPLNAWAFNTKVNPFGARLRVLFGSDIGHWDVPNMSEVVEEAHELVEKEVITKQDLRDFVFTNPVSFYASLNSEFFNGTVVEHAARESLSRREEAG